MKEPIYQISGNHLGDVWSSLNYFYRLSVKENKPIKVSRFFNGMDTSRKIIECLEVLSDPGVLEIVKERPTEPSLPFEAALNCGYYSTRTIWNPARASTSKIICYQLDSAIVKRESILNNRRIPNDVQNKFLNELRDVGWTLENLGGLRPLKECVEIASTSRVFIGAASGLAEICTSVGIPMHIVLHNFPENNGKIIYWGRKCLLHKSLEDIKISTPVYPFGCFL